MMTTARIDEVGERTRFLCSDKARRGAAELMRSPLFWAVTSELSDSIATSIIRTTPEQRAEREQFYYQAQAIELIQGKLRALPDGSEWAVSDEEIAAAQYLTVSLQQEMETNV